jgi:NADPH-dependent glutamate synthase beta subunit-like oxidoreductase
MEHMKPYLYTEQIESPCQDFCPISLSCHGYISLIQEGKFEEAYRLIRQRLPFPLSLGRVCDCPCEKACRRAQLDKTVAIRHLKRFAADYARSRRFDYTPEVKAPWKATVAVIGAGPAGLSAAYDLAREGLSVSVFEALPVAGGMLAVGAPEFRLPSEILRMEIDAIADMGIDIRLNTAVDDAASLLDQGYGAVFVATGCHRGKRLNIDGADLKGVITGVDFLKTTNMKMRQLTEKGAEPGKRVLVLGSGGVAMDCARTAVRLGSRVGVACLENREQIPAEPDEVLAAEEEGVTIHPSRSFVKISGKAGRVTGVEAVRVSNVIFDRDGVPHVEVVEGTRHSLEADTVIFAVGQAPDPQAVFAPLQPDARGLVEITPHTFETGTPGIFAGGDIVRNLGSVVQAIADGQRAALSIIAYLNGQKPSLDQKRRDDELIPISAVLPTEDQIADAPAIPARSIHITERSSSFREVLLPYSDQEAVKEASRCLRCDLLKPADAIRPEGFGMDRDLGKNVRNIETDGIPVSKSFLRRALLHALGIKRKSALSENVIIFGCMYAFGMAKQVLSSLKLLDYLNIDYTFLREKEKCCGLPIVEWIGGKAAEDSAKAFLEWNVSECKKLGAKNVIYLCQWCVYLAKHHLREEATPQVYFLDFVAEHLLREKMSLPPARVGYYEGCHVRRLDFSPGVELNWELYRILLERIEGIEIVDLPHWRCCVTDAERIVEEALDKKIDYLVCSCAACWTWIERVAVRKGLETKMLQDLVLETMDIKLL